jgi:hypothetical protein
MFSHNQNASLSSTEMNLRKFDILARRINAREDTIQEMRKRTTEGCNQTLTEVILQGQDLLQAKADLPHGQWLPWLQSSCPSISERMAQRYMRVASNPTRVSDLAEADSLRAALVLCAEADGAGQPAGPKTWPPFLQALQRFHKFAVYVKDNPINGWPDEGRDKLREELEPIVAALA